MLTLIGVTLVLHNAEEYLTFPGFLSSANRLPRWLPPTGLLHNSQHLRVALVMATVLPLEHFHLGYIVNSAVAKPRLGVVGSDGGE